MATFTKVFTTSIRAAQIAKVKSLSDTATRKWVQIGETEKGLPVMRHLRDFGTSRYAPHQGEKECARRLANLEAGHG
jgi:hypothetical protein